MSYLVSLIWLDRCTDLLLLILLHLSLFFLFLFKTSFNKVRGDVAAASSLMVRLLLCCRGAGLRYGGEWFVAVWRNSVVERGCGSCV